MKISARNQLKGKISNIIHGAVNSEVTIHLPGGSEIVSVITKSAAEKMNLKKGKTAYAIIKASNVMVAVE